MRTINLGQLTRVLVYKLFSYETVSHIRKMVDSANARRLAGARVCCPCCGRTFRHFLSAGADRRLNVRCPNCRSLERHRFVWLFLERKTELLSSTHSLLHVAPERCFYEQLIQVPTLNYMPVDKFTEGNSYPSRIKNMDITAIPSPDNSFDAILCSHVLEHIPDEATALQELHRVLKPNGWAILLVPIRKDWAETYEDPTITTPIEREQAYGQFDHVRYYGRDFDQRLSAAGFQAECFTVQNIFSPDEIAYYRISGSDDIYFCRKRLSSS